MASSQSLLAEALADLITWVDARLMTIAVGAAFRPLLPRPPFQFGGGALDSAPEPSLDLPVLRFWPACLPVGTDRTTGTGAGALQALTPNLRWRQNPNYRDPDFLANYAYAEIVGSAGPIAAPGLSLGVLLLGPATHYPPHRHPAEEIYLPLQPAFWQRGDGGAWLRQPGGAVIHHPSMLAHAMRTEAEALPALYLWRGDLETPATLDPGR